MSSLNFACHHDSNVGGLKSNDLPDSTFFTQASSESLLRHPCLRSLSQNSSEATDAQPHRCPWAHIALKQVLARESHGACFFPTAVVKVAQQIHGPALCDSINHGLGVVHVSSYNFACHLDSNVGGLKLHDLQAST